MASFVCGNPCYLCSCSNSSIQVNPRIYKREVTSYYLFRVSLIILQSHKKGHDARSYPANNFKYIILFSVLPHYSCSGISESKKTILSISKPLWYQMYPTAGPSSNISVTYSSDNSLQVSPNSSPSSVCTLLIVH